MNNFIQTITNMLKSELGDSYSVSSEEIVKNNDFILHGIIINAEHTNVAPTIYLENFFDDYQHGRPLNDIVAEILHIYHTHNDISCDTAFFTDFKKIKGKIFFQIINTESNKRFLKHVPHIPYLDFSIIFKILIDSNPMATITIKENLLDIWQVSLKEVYDAAVDNTPELLPFDIMSMKKVLEELAPELSADLPVDSFMYVLTNHQKIGGSSCILYPNVLLDFSKKINSDFYVLPSSIHEVIMIPAKSSDTPEALSSMVREVNRTQLAPEDFLSNNVYYFSRENNKLVIANA